MIVERTLAAHSGGSVRSAMIAQCEGMPLTCATGSRPRPAKAGITVDSGINSEPRYDLAGPRSAMGIQPLAIERCPDLAEPLCAQLAPVWELIASIPAPRCDHRQHENPALV
jgi:hypothetical protein